MVKVDICECVYQNVYLYVCQHCMRIKFQVSIRWLIAFICLIALKTISQSSLAFLVQLFCDLLL